MGRPGPPRKPTALKRLAGNPGRRPLPTREPKPAPGIPTPPAHLGDEARREWARISGELHRCGLLTSVDRAAVAMYCLAYGRWVEAENKVRELGVVVRSPNNFPIHSPYLAVANKAMDQMIRLLGELGLSPAARTRIEVEKPPADDPDEREFFGPREL